MKKSLSWCSMMIISVVLFLSFPLPIKAGPADFITTWQTTSGGQSITIPTIGTGYNYDIDWGDGNTDTGVAGNATHAYILAGTYTVTISGDFPRIYFPDSGDHPEILSVEQWGSNTWTSMDHAFWGAINLVINATDIPDLSGMTTTAFMFHGTNALSTVPNIDDWDVSNITDMHNMFSISSFNDDISNWNVSNVTNMSEMFYSNESFNQNIGDWDVSNVTNMANIFYGATNFNQDIGSWDVSAVTNMTGALGYTVHFNQDLSSWDISLVTDLTDMFTNTDLSVDNYDAILTAWSLLSLQSNVHFDANTASYCAADEARAQLISEFDWTIDDTGLSEPTCTFTEVPTLLAPVASHTYTIASPLEVSFVLPETLLSGSLNLTFTPSIGSTITLNLRDAAPTVTNTFAFNLTGGFGAITEILSSTHTSIPEGIYTVTLSYRDIIGNAVAAATVSNVTIAYPEGTFRFHLFTDTNGNGTQDSGEDDGFEDAVLSLNDGITTEVIATDDNGNIDSALIIGAHTLTITVPSGYLVTGGNRITTFTISSGAVNDIGNRGVYRRGSSNSHSSSSTRSSSTTSTTSRSISTSSSNTSTTSTTTTSLPTPIARELACLRQGTPIHFSDTNDSAVDYLSSLVFVNDADQHLIRGYNSTSFGPQNSLTRFEALTIAMRSNCISGGNSRQFTHRNSHFVDVPQDNSDQSLIIGEAFSRGIITGVGDRFLPDQTVSFAEMVKMLLTSSAYFQQGQPLLELNITLPAARNSVFAQYLQYAYQLGILPNSWDNASRVNRVTMAELLKKYVESTQLLTMAHN